MSTVCVPTSHLPPLSPGFYKYAGSNPLHYVQDTHSLDVLFLDPEFTSQVLLEGLRGALQVQCHIIIPAVGLATVHTTPRVSLSAPWETVVIF